MTASNQPEGPQLPEILSSITAYSNEVTFVSEAGERSDAALALLEIAMKATAELERVFQTAQDFPASFDDVAEFFREIAPRLSFWPVPFNAVMDPKPYERLRIGYDLIDSKAPSKRTGRTAFSHFAKILVGRIEFFRQETQAKQTAVDPAHDAAKRRNEQLVNFVDRLNGSNAPPPWLLLHKYQPSWLSEIAELPDFSKHSAPRWQDAAKRFFKEAIPHPEEIHDLARAINDRDVELESQMRARIVERIGRAVKAMAP